MYVDEVNAALRKKALSYCFIVEGVVAILFSSLFLFLIVSGSMYVGSDYWVYLALFGAYALGFLAIFFSFKLGYPTSYVIGGDGVKVLFHRRRPVSIPFAVIEKVTLDREGPSFRRMFGGLVYDLTAMKSKQYVAIQTPLPTYYLSPSNPCRFVTELKHGMSKVITRIKSDVFKGLREGQVSKGASQRTILARLFVKTPTGPMFITASIVFGLTVLGYPQLVDFSLIVFWLTLQLVVYLFSPSIASELQGSQPCTIKRVTRIAASLAKKAKCRPPKVEVSDPMVKGLNALATASPFTSKILLTKDILKLSNQELEAVIAHEIGHIKYRHTLKLNMMSLGFLALLLFTSPYLFLSPACLFLVILTVTFFMMSLPLKVLERAADVFAARMTNPTALVSALLRTAKDKAHRLYVFHLIRTGKPKPQEEIKESIGLKRPNRMLRRLFLWVVSTPSTDLLQNKPVKQACYAT